MKIVIAGAGEVGSHLGRLLSEEGQDVILIDEDEERLNDFEMYNLLTFAGRTNSFATLRDSGAKGCDLFIAVTPFESRNLVACAMAKKFGAVNTVARIDNFEYMKPENKPFFTNLGVDDVIYPEYLAAQEILTSLQRTWVRSWFELVDGHLVIVGVKLRGNARLVGMQLKELAMQSGYMHISAIKRNHETIIPGGGDSVHEGDIVYIATTKEFIPNVLEMTGKKPIEVKRVMIMGGSRIAVQLVRAAAGRYKFKIIESDRKRCYELAELLPECNIIHGDGRDVELLQEEGVSDCEAFVALTGSSETNILGCLAAKEYGVKKTIAEVENIQFISEAEGLNIGSVVNKKLLASSRIFQLMLDRDSSNSKCLALADAEVAELVVKEGARITRDAVMNLNLSRDMTIAGLVRDGKGLLVKGNTRIQAGDHVVIFCLQGALHKMEKLFK